MLVGLIKWFDTDKGFGVVKEIGGREYFLHHSNFKDSQYRIEKDFPVFFEAGKEKGRIAAKEARFLKNYEEFHKLVSHFFTSSLNASLIPKETIRCILKTQSEKKLYSYLKRFLKSNPQEDSEKTIKDFFQFIDSIGISKIKEGEDWQNIYDLFRNQLGDKSFFQIWNTDNLSSFLINQDLILQYENELTNRSLNIIFSQNNNELKHQLVKVRVEQLKENFEKRLFDNLQGFVKKYQSTIPLKTQDFFSSYILRLMSRSINTFLSNIVTVNNDGQLGGINKKFRQFLDKYFLTEEDKAKFITSFIEGLLPKCDEEYTFKFYMYGYDFAIDKDLITTQFEPGNTGLQISILARCINQPDFQEYLFSSLLFPDGISSVYDILIKVLGKVNIHHEFSKEYFLSDDNWKDKKGINLRARFIKYYDSIEDSSLRCEYFLKEFTSTYPTKFVKEHPLKFNQNELAQFFGKKNTKQSFIFETLKNSVTQYAHTQEEKFELYDKVLKLSNQFLKENKKETLFNLVKDLVSNDVFIMLWTEGYLNEYPETQILNIESDDELLYERVISKAFKSENNEKVLNTFSKRLELQQSIEIEDRPTFYRFYWTFLGVLRLCNLIVRKYTNSKIYYENNRDETITELNETATAILTKYNSDSFPIHKTILWQLSIIDNEFDFDFLKTKFIYFRPDEQVLIIKKMFSLKERGVFDLTVEKLNEIVRASHDIYTLNEKLHPEIALDLTSDLIISTLFSFKEKRKFLFERQLLEIVLRNLAGDKTQRFKIKDYFETCKGRTTSKINLYNTKGTIKKVFFGEERFYYSIDFKYNESLIEKVKKISGSKWNNEKKIWGVPSKHESEILLFAKENKFLIDLGGNNYECNPHLAVKKLEGIPNGITFCEGRIAKKLDNQRNVPFYWCCNQSCYMLSETVHDFQDWKNYTFLDLCRILDFNVDEVNDYGTSPNGKYYQFIGLINRFNRLLDRLYCTGCNHFLHPVKSSNFAHHRVVRFSCENDACSSKEEVYLHHCLNGRCNSIIDSRVSKKCEHGLVICENCLSCCSHKMLSFVLSNLQQTGGYINPKMIALVDGRLGHVERGIHFCYKCGEKMEQIGAEEYRCPNGHLEKDLSEFKMKRRQDTDD